MVCPGIRSSSILGECGAGRTGETAKPNHPRLRRWRSIRRSRARPREDTRHPRKQGTSTVTRMSSVKLGLTNQLGRFNRNYVTVDPDLWCYGPNTW